MSRGIDDTAVEHGTGEILAEFAIDPHKGYQPKEQNAPDPKTVGVNDVTPHP